jgi:AcrR family transcriptional regulator
MAVERLTPERRRDRTRQTLLDAAAEVFARKGFVAASLDEIAELAGFSRGAIHHHFDSKEELFLAVLERHNERLLAAFEERIGSAQPFPVDPAVNAAQWRDIHADDGDDVLLMLEFRTYVLRNPELRSKLADVEQRAVTATADMLTAQAKRAGLRWRLPVDEVAELLHTTSRSLLERGAVIGSDGEALMRSFLAMVWATALEPVATTGRESRRSG